MSGLLIRITKLWPIESECFVCGILMLDAKHAVSRYEDIIFPDDYEGPVETAGHDVCDRCKEIHAQISKPITQRDFRTLYLGDKHEG